MNDRQRALKGHSAGLGGHILFGNATLDEAIREFFSKGKKPAIQDEIRVKRDKPGIFFGLFDQRLRIRRDKLLRGIGERRRQGVGAL